MDQLYFEEGYIEAGYLTRVREASVDLSPYFVDGYLPDDYFTYSGSSFTLTAELTPAGVDVFATGSWSSAFTQTVAISRTRSGDSSLSTAFTQTANANVIRGFSISMSATFTQTAAITHIEGVDLFAFSDAALSAQVSRLRDSNISVSAVFSAAIDISRIVQVNADESAAFSFTTTVVRSRDSASSLEAAFSLAASAFTSTNGVATLTSAFTSTISAIRLRGISSTPPSEFSVSANANRIVSPSAELTSAFTQTANVSKSADASVSMAAQLSVSVSNDRIRSFSSSQAVSVSLTASLNRTLQANITLNVNASLSATISHIHGADLVAFSNASLSATSTITRGAAASLASEFALSGSLTGTRSAGAAFSVVSTLSSNSRVNIRTTTVTEVGGSGYVTATIDTSIKKWGAGSLKWTIPSADEYPTSNIVWTGSAFKAFSNGFTWTSSNGTDWTRATNDLSGYGGFYDITYANGNFVAWDSNNNRYKSSSNGTTWTNTTLTSSVWVGSGLTGPREVYYINSNYYAFGTAVIGTTRTLISYRSSSLTGSWARFDISGLISDANLNGGSGIADIKLVGSTAYITTTFYDNFNAVYSRGTRFTGTAAAGFSILSANTGHLFAQKSSWDGANDYLAHVVDVDEDYNDGSNPNYGYIYWKNASTTGSYSFNQIVVDISYANGVWFIATNNGLYKTTAVDTAPTLVDIDIESEVQYQTSKYIAYSNTYDGYVKTSTDSITWTYADIDPQIIPGSLSYSRGDNSDIGTFKTLDFWYYNADSSTGSKFAFTQSATRYISFGTGSTNYLEIQNVSGVSTSNLSITETSILPLNTWTHIRLSIDSSNASLYVGGTRKATTTTWLGGVTAPLKIGGATSPAPVQYAAQFDEIFITDQLITAPSLTSFSVPTQAWNNSSTDVDLLLHFNTDFADDTAFFVDPSASLSSTASLTASLTGTKTFASAMASQSTLTAVIGKLNEIVLTAFNNASLTTAISKTTGFASSQSAAFSISAVNARTRDAASAQSSEFSQALTFDRFRTGSSTIASEFTQSTTAVKTTSVVSNNSSEFAQSTSVIKTAEATLSLTSAFTPVVTALATKNGEIILQTAATFAAASSRTRGLTAGITSTSTLSLEVTRIRPGASSLTSQFAVDASPTGTIFAAALFTSEFTQTAAVQRNRFGEAAFSSVFQQNTNTQDSLARQGSASLSVSTALSAVNTRVRFATINTEAIFSELVVTAVSASAVTAMAVTATMAITATRTRGHDSAITATAALSVPGERITASAQAALSVQAAISIEGTTNITGEADLAVNTTLTALGQRGREIVLVAFGNAALTTTAARTRTAASTMSVVATMSMSITKLVTTSATLVSTASFTAAGTRQRNATATLIANGGVLVVGKVIKVDTYVYEIPSETRIHIIASETRKYTIRSETRKHTIRRA
jgi:hypothetical protein